MCATAPAELTTAQRKEIDELIDDDEDLTGLTIAGAVTASDSVCSAAEELLVDLLDARTGAIVRLRATSVDDGLVFGNRELIMNGAPILQRVPLVIARDAIALVKPHIDEVAAKSDLGHAWLSSHPSHGWQIYKPERGKCDGCDVEVRIVGVADALESSAVTFLLAGDRIIASSAAEFVYCVMPL